MNAQVASSLFLLFGEFLALMRDFFVHRRQEQAEALRPGADAIKARIDELVRHALEAEASLPKPPVYPAPPEPQSTVQDHGQALKDHIDALVAAAHAHVTAASAPGTASPSTPGGAAPSAAPEAQPATTSDDQPAASG